MRVLYYFFGVTIVALLVITFTIPTHYNISKPLKDIRHFELENKILTLKMEILQKELQEEKDSKNIILQEKLKIKQLLEMKNNTNKKQTTTKINNILKLHEPGKILFHLHFHKAAGTTICNLARFNGYRTTKTNCNFWKNQTCCGETVAQQKTVAKRLLTSKHPYDFVANEKFLPEKLDHEYFEYMIMFRKPLERYASHYKYIRNNYQQKTRNIGNFSTWLQCQPDNFMFRNFCGKRCLKKKRGELNRDDMEYVKNKLLGFKAVLILERFDESIEIMQEKFGWINLMDEINKRKKPARKRARNQLKIFDKSVYSESDLIKFKFMTSFDDELYAFAEYINTAQIEALKYRQNYSSLSKKCKTSCCCKNTTKCSVYR